MKNYASNAYKMPYGDWVRREAALKRIDPGELERMLEVVPFRVRTIVIYPLNLGRKKLERTFAEFYAVTDFEEHFAPAVRIPFLSAILPIYEYWASGTGINTEPMEVETITIENLNIEQFVTKQIE